MLYSWKRIKNLFLFIIISYQLPCVVAKNKMNKSRIINYYVVYELGCCEM